MATDIGRINAAMGGIRALDYQGSETREVLSHLGALALAVKKAKAPGSLRCAVDYQDAPNGTKVAKRFGSGWWRKIDDGWIDESCTVMPGNHIATAPREVLKWGGA